MAVSVVQLGVHDAVVDGELVSGIPSRLVFVGTPLQLSHVGGNFQVGSLAATFNMQNMWIKISADTWNRVAGDGPLVIMDEITEETIVVDPAGG